MNTQVNNKVQDALQSLDDMQRAQASPYLFTRILGKMQESSMTVWEKLAVVITRPQLAILLVVLVLALNFIVANHTEAEEVALRLQETEQYFAREHNPSNFYSFENTENR